MKILSLRLKNLNSLKGEWKIDFTAEPLPATGCLPLPERVKPRCWMPSAWRFITKRRACKKSLRRKMT
jgi:hypothetical protein